MTGRIQLPVSRLIEANAEAQYLREWCSIGLDSGNVFTSLDVGLRPSDLV